MRCCLVVVLVGAALTQGCARPAPVGARSLSEEERAEVARAVEERVARYAEATRARDVEAMLGFWADSDELVFAGDGSVLVGRDAFARHLEEVAGGHATVDRIVITSPHVYVLAPDAAVYTSEFEWSLTTRSGETVASHGSWTYVFIQQGGEWRVIHSAGTHLYGASGG